MSDHKNQHISFWQSTPHLYGCYGGILMCILVICNFSSLGWFAASFWGYILGRIFYWIQSHFIEETFEIPSAPNAQLEQPNPSPEVKSGPDVRPQPPKDLSIFAHFSILKHQVEPLLPEESKLKIEEIHALLTVLNRKLNNSKDLETRRAIQKIQRVINNYLVPSLTYYQELPVMFHDRPIDHGDSPNLLMLKQLSLVHDELLQITEHVFSEDLNALLDHGQFLEQKLKTTHFFKVGHQLEHKD